MRSVRRRIRNFTGEPRTNQPDNYQIQSASTSAQALEHEFTQHPPPALDTLVKFHRVLILQLGGHLEAHPAFADVLSRMLRTAAEIEREQLRTQLEQRRVELAEQKFQFDAAAACLAHLPEFKAISQNSELTLAEQIDQIRIRLFGVAV